MVLKTESFDRDPGWVGVNNRSATTRDPIKIRQDFGYSAKTAHAGGRMPGEIGGFITPAGEAAFYGKAHRSGEARSAAERLGDNDHRQGWHAPAARLFQFAHRQRMANAQHHRDPAQRPRRQLLRLCRVLHLEMAGRRRYHAVSLGHRSPDRPLEPASVIPATRVCSGR